MYFNQGADVFQCLLETLLRLQVKDRWGRIQLGMRNSGRLCLLRGVISKNGENIDLTD